MITTEQVKELRDQTGVSVMQCKKALEEAAGDMEKAIAILKKKSADIASKKAEREAKEGAVAIKTKGDKTAIVALNCETDFVAKNEDFTKLTGTLAEMVLEKGIEETQIQSADMINQAIQKTGENIQIGKLSLIEGEVVGTYVHGGKSGFVVSLSAGTPEFAKDIAMHIAAMKPEYLSRDEINNETKEMVMELYKKEVDESGKPEEIKAKVLEGKVNTYFKERTLNDQPFIKNGDSTVGDLLNKAGAKILKVEKFSIK